MATIQAVENQDYFWPVLSTTIYFLLFQVFMVNQIWSKIVAGRRLGDPRLLDRFDYSSKHWEMGDRSFLNFLEQTPAVVALMWMDAIFCSARSAGIALLVYCVFRLLFPVFWAVKGRWNLLIEASTQPCYAIMNYWTASLLYLAVTGRQLGAVMPSNVLLVVIVVVLIHLGLTVVVFLVGGAFAKLLEQGFESEGASPLEESSSDAA
uniref:MAPEG family protein n=1 Tax=Alexandrium andersonii TaxID=327968 RepID=A0A7S2AHL1_9DINO|mmetsp:Transcript_1146/g.2496  ORF Transcript_1146/g.2496 Transcript_1146/m.2496 type:complete len:207 (+) Transcript_1146:78-698(+)